jgi:hypothetical protein
MHVFGAVILQRFPELKPKIFKGDEDLPSVMGAHLARLLAESATTNRPHPLAERVLDFHRWCAEQPRGQSAQDDLLTIEMVGFIEELFKYDTQFPLIRRLVTKEALLRNRDYWVKWIGEDRYRLALRE